MVAFGICCLGQTCGGIFCLGKTCAAVSFAWLHFFPNTTCRVLTDCLTSFCTVLGTMFFSSTTLLSSFPFGRHELLFGLILLELNDFCDFLKSLSNFTSCRLYARAFSPTNVYLSRASSSEKGKKI